MRPSPAETAHRDALISELRTWIHEGRKVLLGPQGQSPFAGTCDGFTYGFEGEDDLLHLAVSRASGEPLTVEEAQRVAAFACPGVAPGVIWLKPAERSHHFYFGHDELLSE